MILQYKDLCPNCGKDITSLRLEKALPCEICLPDTKKEIKPGKISLIKERNKKVEEIEKIFEKISNAHMWALQRFWVRRFLDGESFCISAPTGSGKTTIQIILSLYSASVMKKRCLMILPTSILVNQVVEKLFDFKSKLNLDLEVAYYHSLLSRKEKREQLEKMNWAGVIVTTHISLMKKEEINRQKIDLIFVDDVDSFLKKSKSVYFALKMLKLPKKIEEIIEKVKNKEIEIAKAINEIKNCEENIDSQIIVSGATQKSRRTKSIRLLSSIFSFSVGGKVEFGRNVVDCYLRPKKSIEETVLDLIKKLGKGGLIFVPSDKGSDFAKWLENYLENKGVKVKAFIKPKKEYFEKFVKGEIDALIGNVTLRSPLVRGIDLPHRIKYAIFVGVPKFLLKIRPEEFHPVKWLMLLNSISSSVKEEYKEDFEFLFANLAKIKNMSSEQLEKVRSAIKEGRKLEGLLEFARKIALKGIEFFKKILKDEDVLKKLKESETISFVSEGEEYSFLITDEIAYIQASGRTSRLYVGGITKGLSILIIDEEKAFKNLVKELKYFEEVEWKNFEEIDVKKITEEIEEDRKKVLLAMEGKLNVKENLSIRSILFIVESPNKAKTIARYFGRPSQKKVLGLNTYEIFIQNFLTIVTSTGGHITDLVTNEGLFGVKVNDTFIPIFKAIKRCLRCGNEIEEEEEVCTNCNSSKFIDAAPKIEALRKLASLVDEVIIGTDPDSEGEKIAYDLNLLIKPVNKHVKRARFHEVTKKGIVNALNNLEDFDLNLVNAQILRRIEDRWIGFAISPALWKVFNNNKLSAGRVQTPVLGWIYERSKKLKEKEELIFLTLKNGLKLKFRDKVGSYNKILKNKVIEILDIEKKIEEINPFPPFTTDALIASLTSTLKINAAEAMTIAQKLFENGLITYHRTTSTTVSGVGMNVAKEYISSTFGEEFFKGRKWQMEGAHECIRPTKPLDVKKLKRMVSLGMLRFSSPLKEKEYIAYDIIFKRFMASQMKSCKVEKILIKIKILDKKKEFEFPTKIIEEGFNKIVMLNTFYIPEISKGRYGITFLKKMLVPAYYPYTYSEIVSEMKEKGIGRPSTYAKILEILKRRNYVIEISKSKLNITSLGTKVYLFLRKNFEKYVSEETTKKLEEEMDKVEKGKAKTEEILKEFHQEILKIIKHQKFLVRSWEKSR